MGGSIPLWLTIFVLLLAGCLAVLSLLIVRFEKKLRTFMSGKDGASLEATLSWLTHKVASIDDTLEAHKEALEFIDARVKKSIRGYSLVRYDAYEGSGGEQSFASGLLDEHGNGYVLSVIVSRSHTGVYAKKIISGTAEASLTNEEKLALEEALAAIK